MKMGLFVEVLVLVLVKIRLEGGSEASAVGLDARCFPEDVGNALRDTDIGAGAAADGTTKRCPAKVLNCNIIASPISRKPPYIM